jgi:hypothetical protein
MNGRNQLDGITYKYNELPKIAIVELKKKRFKRELKKLNGKELFKLLDYFEFLEKYIGKFEREKIYHQIVKDFDEKRFDKIINKK